jgi:hypothetical protein
VVVTIVGIWAFAVTENFATYSRASHAGYYSGQNWRGLGGTTRRCELEGDVDDRL